jgi:hypothetical protein
MKKKTKPKAVGGLLIIKSDSLSTEEVKEIRAQLREALGGMRVGVISCDTSTDIQFTKF